MCMYVRAYVMYLFTYVSCARACVWDISENGRGREGGEARSSEFKPPTGQQLSITSNDPLSTTVTTDQSSRA
ncbi:hypothetical protein F5X96DRAFT_637264, partial [Biscogniauxia mediterranea]